MPYKTFFSNTEALAEDVNRYLMQQAIATFADPSARAAAIPVPVVGQVTHLANRLGVLQVFNGSLWIDLVSANPYMQWTMTSKLTDAYGAIVVPIGGTFNGVPTVVVCDASAWGYAASAPAPGIIPSLVDVTSTSCTIKFRGHDGGSIANGAVRVSLIAVGFRMP